MTAQNNFSDDMEAARQQAWQADRYNVPMFHGARVEPDAKAAWMMGWDAAVAFMTKLAAWEPDDPTNLCVICPHSRGRHLAVGHKLAARGAKCAECECLGYEKPGRVPA